MSLDPNAKAGASQPQALAPVSGGVPAAIGVPAPAPAAPAVLVAPPAALAVSRPAGVSAIALVEAGIGVMSVVVVLTYLYWIDYWLGWDDMGHAALDMAMAAVYLASVGFAYRVVTALWSMQQSAWRLAVTFNLAMLGVGVVGVGLFGITTLDVVGFTVHVAVLACLNLASVRAAFGRPPLSILAG